MTSNGIISAPNTKEGRKLISQAMMSCFEEDNRENPNRAIPSAVRVREAIEMIAFLDYVEELQTKRAIDQHKEHIKKTYNGVHSQSQWLKDKAELLCGIK